MIDHIIRDHWFRSFLFCSVRRKKALQEWTSSRHHRKMEDVVGSPLASFYYSPQESTPASAFLIIK